MADAFLRQHRPATGALVNQHARDPRGQGARLGDQPRLKRSKHDGISRPGPADRRDDGRNGRTALELDLHDGTIADQREHLGQRRNRFAANAELTQCAAGELRDATAAAREADQRIVVKNNRHAVARHLNVQLHAVNAEFQGAAERGEGVFRRLG